MDSVRGNDIQYLSIQYKYSLIGFNKGLRLIENRCKNLVIFNIIATAKLNECNTGE